MKIAEVTHRYHPNIGGIETHVKEISERLAKNHDVEVITADLSPVLRKTETINGVTISRFSSIHPGNAVYFSPHIGSYLKKNTFDIIHAHNYHAIPALSASMAAKDNLIFSPYYHGRGRSMISSALLKPYSHFGKKIFKKARKIICISEYEKMLIQRDFTVDDSFISIIPSGINLKSIQNSQPFESSNNVILYIGRLDRYKNIDLVIKAMQYLPDFKFYIIGKSGNYKKELLNLIGTMNLTERVRILDTISDKDKNRWLKTCSLFVNLSDMESFGITVLEAVAAGKPVIVNNAGGLAELAAQFPQITPIERKNYSSERTLMELASLMNQKSGHDHQQNLQNYDWDDISKKMENEYFSIVEGK